MLNRIVVTIDGLPYTVIAEETEEYIRKNAALVNKEIEDIKAATPFSSMTAAVLAGACLLLILRMPSWGVAQVVVLIILALITAFQLVLYFKLR